VNDKIDDTNAKADVSDGRRAKGGRRAVMKKALPWVVNICRLLLAVTFLFSGFVKANDPLGTSYKLQDYYAAVGLNSFSGWVTLVESVALSFIEFSLGVCLLMGLNRRFVAICTTTFMAVMTVVTLWLAVSNAVTDCGCFGDALILSNTQTFVKNLILLGASLVVLKWSRLQKRFITENNAWLVSTPAMVGIVFYAFYCIYHLPVIDFRPYHVGADLVKLREEPELGSKMTYKLHELDVMDLYILDAETEEDVTDSILYREGETFLLVAPDLTTADEGCAGSINMIYDYALQKGYGFFCLTASDAEAQSHWTDYTGAEYRYYTADERTLKTMVRANPGLILLKDGKVVEKWSNWMMPEVN